MVYEIRSPYYNWVEKNHPQQPVTLQGPFFIAQLSYQPFQLPRHVCRINWTVKAGSREANRKLSWFTSMAFDCLWLMKVFSLISAIWLKNDTTWDIYIYTVYIFNKIICTIYICYIYLLYLYHMHLYVSHERSDPDFFLEIFSFFGIWGPFLQLGWGEKNHAKSGKSRKGFSKRIHWSIIGILPQKIGEISWFNQKYIWRTSFFWIYTHINCS